MEKKQAKKLVGELIIQTKMPKQRRKAAAKPTTCASYEDVSDNETTTGSIAEEIIERTVASLSARTVVRHHTGLTPSLALVNSATSDGCYYDDVSDDDFDTWLSSIGPAEQTSSSSESSVNETSAPELFAEPTLKKLYSMCEEL